MNPEAAIDLSIIMVAGDQRERANGTLSALLSQGGLDRSEVLLLDASSSSMAPLPAASHPAVRTIRQDRAVSYGEMRARGARLARGRWIGYIEEHCLPLEGWLVAARSAIDGPWDAFGGEMHSGNPGVGISDATAMMNYGDWRPPTPRGDARLLPGHNAFYRRDVLLTFGPALGDLLQAEAALHMKMTEAGYRLGIEPAVRFAHLNETHLALICRAYYFWHRAFGGIRMREARWGWMARIVRTLSTPLVPWVRAYRLHATLLRGRRSDIGVFWRFLPVILVAQSASALGLACGYLFGPGRAPDSFLYSELDAERPMSGQE